MVCCLLFVVGWLLFVGGWWLVVGCWLLVVVVVVCVATSIEFKCWTFRSHDVQLRLTDTFKMLMCSIKSGTIPVVLEPCLLIKVDPKLANKSQHNLCFSILVLLIRDNVYMDLRI